MGQLDYSTWVHCNPLRSLEDDNITVTLQKGCIGTDWCTSEEKCYTNYSSKFLNIDHFTLYNEGK